MGSTLPSSRQPRPAYEPSVGRQEPSARPPQPADACAPRSLTLSVKETAFLLGVSASTVYRLVRADRIPFKRVGRRILIARDELEAWLGAHARRTDRNASR